MPNPEPQAVPRPNQQQISIKSPEEFDFNQPETWPKWEKRFLKFLSVADLSWKTSKEKTELLCYTMGEQSDEILYRILPNAEDKSFEEVLKAFSNYFTPQKNVIRQRLKFHARVQLVDESVDHFITALHCLAETCDFSIEKENLIRDRIVVGIRDNKTSERLRSMADLNLAKAITVVNQAKLLSKEQSLTKGSIQKKDLNSEAVGESGSNKKYCHYCGFPKHPKGVWCRARNSICRECGKRGHWHLVCKEKITHDVTQEPSSSKNTEDMWRMNSISHSSAQSSSVAVLPNHANILDLPDVGLRAVVEGSERFSNQFFKVLAGRNPGNLIISPLSAQILLAMAAYGARGETAIQMRKALQIPNDTYLGLNGYRSLIKTMNAEKGVELRIATKIFIARGVDVQPSYHQITDKRFMSSIQNVNFRDSQAAANTINTWCEQQTNKRISNIVGPGNFTADTVFVLVNAVYFKGQWCSPFEQHLTQNKPFRVDEINTKFVPIMRNTDRFRFGDLPKLDARFIEMPYKGDNLSMIIILPNSIMGLKKVQDNLHHVNLQQSLQVVDERYVVLSVPKFKIRGSFDLQPTLETLGMSDMFRTTANFSGIADDPLRITQALQTAFIEVNETGTEAVARMSLRGGATNIPTFTVDHPFYFAIYHRPTGISLFSGIVEDPASG